MLEVAELRNELETLRSRLERLLLEFEARCETHAPDELGRSYRARSEGDQSNDRMTQTPVAPPEKIPTEVAPAAGKPVPDAYLDLWNTMTILPQWKDEALSIADRIVANQGRYAAAVTGTAIPWWFVAVVHAMECGLNFKQHLHNGDPLTSCTVNVPRGRPPIGKPPFTWEESARDAVTYEKLDKVSDWSLPSALYHWHRYNGIENAYKRLAIPTPYLWSGSQHYRKGKYVKDGVFDPEATSKQVGAAVLLRTLIDIDAVHIDAANQLASNPAAATQHVRCLNIAIQAPVPKQIGAELEYPVELAIHTSDKMAVKRLQEWLNIHDCCTGIDSDFGDSTLDQLMAFQVKHGRQPTGVVDPETWMLLTAPMRRALASIDHDPSTSFEDAVVRVAKQHVAEKPIEVGGNNLGPWVRLYMAGLDGESQRWCAGFVCFIVAQACRDLKMAIPFKRQVGVDALVEDAKASGRFIPETAVTDPMQRKSMLRPGYIYVERKTDTDWVHTGLVLTLKDTTFDTLEGNTGTDGGVNGPNARQSNRSYKMKDFIRLL